MHTSYGIHSVFTCGFIILLAGCGIRVSPNVQWAGNGRNHARFPWLTALSRKENILLQVPSVYVFEERRSLCQFGVVSSQMLSKSV